jgi:hypothetical protein
MDEWARLKQHLDLLPAILTLIQIESRKVICNLRALLTKTLTDAETII